MAEKRKAYTIDEDVLMCQLLSKRLRKKDPIVDKPYGLEVWTFFKKRGYFPTHTSQSLATHMRRHVFPKFETMRSLLDRDKDEDKKIFDELKRKYVRYMPVPAEARNRGSRNDGPTSNVLAGCSRQVQKSEPQRTSSLILGELGLMKKKRDPLEILSKQQVREIFSPPITSHQAKKKRHRLFNDSRHPFLDTVDPDLESSTSEKKSTGEKSADQFLKGSFEGISETFKRALTAYVKEKFDADISPFLEQVEQNPESFNLSSSFKPKSIENKPESENADVGTPYDTLQQKEQEPFSNQKKLSDEEDAKKKSIPSRFGSKNISILEELGIRPIDEQTLPIQSSAEDQIEKTQHHQTTLSPENVHETQAFLIMPDENLVEPMEIEDISEDQLIKSGSNQCGNMNVVQSEDTLPEVCNNRDWISWIGSDIDFESAGGYSTPRREQSIENSLIPETDENPGVVDEGPKSEEENEDVFESAQSYSSPALKEKCAETLLPLGTNGKQSGVHKNTDCEPKSVKDTFNVFGCTLEEIRQGFIEGQDEMDFEQNQKELKSSLRKMVMLETLGAKLGLSFEKMYPIITGCGSMKSVYLYLQEKGQKRQPSSDSDDE